MIERSLSLIPVPAANIPAISLTGTISLEESSLCVHYCLTGDLEDLLLPPVSLKPSRKDDLWKATCFEFFLAIEDQPGYWEFNMSPSGDWNAYRMDAYRRVGFREETAISRLPFAFKREPDRYLLDVFLDLTPILQPEDELQMGITAIIQTRGGSETYWALAHPAPNTDFHIRESFILALAAQTHPSGQSVLPG